MAENSFHFSLRTPVSELYNGSADSVHLATDEGEMEIFPTHASVVGTIHFSKVVVKNGEQKLEYLVRHGIVTVNPDGNDVRILAQDAQKQSDMQIQSLEHYQTFILERLKKPEELSKYQITFLEDQHASLQKSMEILKKEPKKNT